MLCSLCKFARCTRFTHCYCLCLCNCCNEFCIWHRVNNPIWQVYTRGDGLQLLFVAKFNFFRFQFVTDILPSSKFNLLMPKNKQIFRIWNLHCVHVKSSTIWIVDHNEKTHRGKEILKYKGSFFDAGCKMETHCKSIQLIEFSTNKSFL